MQGTGIALANGPRIVFDSFNDHGEDGKVDKALVEKTVRDFISRRKDHQLYSVERVVDVNGKKERDSLKVHSADPVAVASRRRATEILPSNLKKCPFCSFMTPYDELYTIHVRSHGFMV